MASTGAIKEGGCYCGVVRYVLYGELGPCAHCHCRNCRRAHAAAFSTVVLVDTERFEVTAGAKFVEEYPTGTGYRFFCKRCGGRLFNRSMALPGKTTLCAATLDAERDIEPSMHINVESKARWYRITDSLPTFDGLPALPEVNDV